MRYHLSSCSSSQSSSHLISITKWLRRIGISRKVIAASTFLTMLILLTISRTDHFHLRSTKTSQWCLLQKGNDFKTAKVNCIISGSSSRRQSSKTLISHQMLSKVSRQFLSTRNYMAKQHKTTPSTTSSWWNKCAMWAPWRDLPSSKKNFPSLKVNFSSQATLRL